MTYDDKPPDHLRTERNQTAYAFYRHIVWPHEPPALRKTMAKMSQAAFDRAITQKLESYLSYHNARAREYADDFNTSLRNFFPADRDRIHAVLAALHLPSPAAGSFVPGTFGSLLFLDDYGIVIRIEIDENAPVTERQTTTRINDHPRILQPIATIPLQGGCIEICPGTGFEDDTTQDRKFLHDITDSGVQLWDTISMTRNLGRLPFKTPVFPQGVPILVDRTSVRRLTIESAKVRAFLANSQMGVARDPQQTLYADLRAAFAAAWPAGADSPAAEKIDAFWDACRAHVAQGILIAGWKNPPRKHPNQVPTPLWNAKLPAVGMAGAKYAREIAAYRRKLFPDTEPPDGKPRDRKRQSPAP